MLDETSGSELFWKMRDWTVKNGNVMWIWIELLFNNNCIEISIKKSTFDVSSNYLKLSEHQLSSLINQKPVSQLEIPQWA